MVGVLIALLLLALPGVLGVGLVAALGTPPPAGGGDADGAEAGEEEDGQLMAKRVLYRRGLWEL
jgi:UPF0716 family protein affecting phage T7 exclusion